MVIWLLSKGKEQSDEGKEQSDEGKEQRKTSRDIPHNLSLIYALVYNPLTVNPFFRLLTDQEKLQQV